ncbi:MAG: arsenate reductase (azurin) small subunit [Betaproteobacteria bacterium]|nr:arsenate reductase (azurin) small subunit [Betaproteobacteria bacterium]MBI2227035.1 arsenate reductase (azurin) small subunit [Betaproteobacteria bacterium]MBI3056452.1 arsenate reductase (azurin) small subunit [Betaproteobacteria bacterium]
MDKQFIPLQQPHEHSEEGARACMSRRQFLLASGAVVSLAAVPGFSLAAPLQALKADYPKVKIGKLSALKPGVPVEFSYPYPNVHNILVKLGVPAGAGVGKDSDVVAFNQQCTHMGGPMQGTYKTSHQVIGPCPLHLTTFDLTRHGMVVSGHGTESLPQIVLEIQGNDIYAVGVLGLIYGYSANVTSRRA